MKNEMNTAYENENTCPECESDVKVRIVPRYMADGNVYYEYEYYYEEGCEF